MSRLEKKLTIALICLITILAIVIGTLLYRNRLENKLIEDMNASYKAIYDELVMEVNGDKLLVEYGESFNQDELIKSYEGEISSDSVLDVKSIGTQAIKYTLEKKDVYNQIVKRDYEYTFTVEDNNAPIIELKEDSLEFVRGTDIDITSNVVKVYDEIDGELKETTSLSNNTYCVSSDININEVGEYIVKVIAKDKNGLKTEKEFKVTIIDKIESEYPYYIRINRLLNNVTIYTLDTNGEYTIPYKAMVCSTGSATPLGIYNTTINYRWRALYGGVYGQYATRIVNDILFHSVPYYSQNLNDLEYEEYNKLGTNASMGCIRLCVEDAKWIFDNCPIGTAVELYDDENSPGPLGKPTPITIDINNPNRGWDPTDPDPNNPWK